jgi:hypothetical protein
MGCQRTGEFYRGREKAQKPQKKLLNRELREQKPFFTEGNPESIRGLRLRKQRF